ncbi:MAG: lasso peptide biosynthesis B2 protein [Limisphaerales bacterium]
MKIWWARIHRRWLALRQLRSPGSGSGWLFLRVLAFAAAVPVLMRLKLPVLNRLLERRIASAAGAGGDANGPGQIVRCLDSALAVGAPLVRPGCLTRGLTLYYFLRRAGLDVMLCFGVRWKNGELIGHCWLEKGGEPFLEGGSLDRYAAPIYSLPATEPKPADKRLRTAA